MLKPGDTYRLTRDEGIGSPTDPGFVANGTEVTVREVVAAHENGAHDNSEESIVVTIPVPYKEDGASMTAERAFSVGKDSFHDWFEAV